MTSKKLFTLAASVAFLWASRAHAQTDARSAYSYVRDTAGQVTVVSEANGSVEARRNLPISAGDSLSTDDPGRAEIALADGNVLNVGGGTQLKFASLAAQQGSDDQVSAIDLTEGSVILSVVGNEEGAVPRIDTDDATVYASLGSRVRVNADSRHGTSVVVRAGSVEVRARAGSYTVRAGNYLTVNGDQEPEIARGEFSRDRFDGWAADRLQVTAESTRSASSRYVGEEYAGDAQSLDGYGDWQYNDTYSTDVWRPNVAAGWSPYSNGSWYYTPAGLSWWSWDPWGWFPFHYGNWFFDAGWNSWCWSPGFVYSPAWVCWGFSGSYFGWCPFGWYGGFSPWWNSYFRQWSFPRANVFLALNGRFDTRRVDLRGWNFTSAQNVGGRGRLDVVNGTRVVNRLGSDFSISSRPLVVQARGNVRDALREQIREAPRAIERTAGRDSERLAPVVAREARLPAASVDALRQRAAVAERGRLSGPGASDLAPRGTTVVDRGAVAGRTDSVRRDDRSGRTMITNRPTRDASPERGPAATAPDRGPRPEVVRPQTRSDSSDSWRGRSESQAPRTVEPDRGRATRAPETRGARPADSNQQRADAWRESTRSAPAPRADTVQRGTQSWRSRSEVPPARRVIEGAVPGRRAPDNGRGSEAWRQAPPSRDSGPASRNREVAPPRRDYAPQREFAPREAPPRNAPPRDRAAPPPAYRSMPSQRDYAPRDYAPRDSAPRGFSPREAPRSFSAPPSAPRSFDRGSSSRSAPHSSAPPHSSPPSSHGRPGRS